MSSRTVWRLAVAAVAAGLFVVLASPVQVHLANQIVLAGIAALGLMLLLGAAGLLSLGHAALLGVGGFSVGVLTQEVGAPWWLTLPAAVLAGALLGVLVGLPSLRLRGVYLVLSTLALHFAVVYVGSEYQARRRAASGILVPEPVLGPFTLSDQRVWLVVLLGVLALTVLLIRNLLRTRTGRAWAALRQRELAASSLGIDLTAAKLTAFVVSSGLTSLAGALGAYYHHFVAIEGYSFGLTVQYIAMVLVGGVASVGGTLIGAALIVLLPELISALLGALQVPPQLRLYSFAVQHALFGVLLGACIMFAPEGLAGAWHSFTRRTANWRIRPPRRQQPAYAASSNWSQGPQAFATDRAEDSSRSARAARSSAGDRAEVPSRPVRAVDDRELPLASHDALAAARSDVPEPLLAVRGLTVCYGQAVALTNLSLEVPAGSIVALLGPNGAGKSSTLRAISGALPADDARITHGQITLAGQPTTRWPASRVASAGAILVPERDKIFTTLTVEHNLSVVRQPVSRAELADTLRYFPELEHRRHMRAGYLSGGERQMLALAAALLCRPRLLLVDELSLGLAPQVVERLLRVLADLRATLGLSILVVEQNATVALDLADYAYVLAGGRLVLEGPSAALAASARLAEHYLGQAEHRLADVS